MIQEVTEGEKEKKETLQINMLSVSVCYAEYRTINTHSAKWEA